ncbi:hypothetical protein [Ewingella americana]|uniref:Uncharacterized protein n=1 Tax=Ewingella americana TaxID=41202 RepID=A0A502GEK4_9GAMM|nr:hypothetical protein [Ewingella americana]TPG60052.1 hypothetical protein EAH77_15915 [Ewingella americana]
MKPSELNRIKAQTFFNRQVYDLAEIREIIERGSPMELPSRYKLGQAVASTLAVDGVDTMVAGILIGIIFYNSKIYYKAALPVTGTSLFCVIEIPSEFLTSVEELGAIPQPA